MNTESEKRSRLEGNDARYYPVCCFLPGIQTQFGLSVFGGIIVLVGGFWLLTTLDLLPRLVQDSLGPIVVILIGIAYLINSLLIRE